MTRLTLLLIALVGAAALTIHASPVSVDSSGGIGPRPLGPNIAVVAGVDSNGAPAIFKVNGDGTLSMMQPAYTLVSGTSVVLTGTSTQALRAADPAAVKSVVVNTGTNGAVLMEGGAVIAVLNPDQTWESSLSGKLALSGSGRGVTTLYVATYK